MDIMWENSEGNVSIGVVKRDGSDIPTVRFGEDEITVFEWQKLKERVDHTIWIQLESLV